MEANDEPEARRKLRFLIRARRYWHHLRNANHRNVARAAVAAHMGYYSLVFIESHSWYGYAGGICGVILLIEVILGRGHGEE